jgi:hypothetical protein
VALDWIIAFTTPSQTTTGRMTSSPSFNFNFERTRYKAIVPDLVRKQELSECKNCNIFSKYLSI